MDTPYTVDTSSGWKMFLWFVGIATTIITAIKLVPKLWKLLVGAAKFIAAIDKVTPVLAKLGFEMSTNSGSSMKDKLDHAVKIADEALDLVKQQGASIVQLRRDGDEKREMLEAQNEVLTGQNRVLASHQALMDKIQQDIEAAKHDIKETQHQTVADLKEMLDRRVVLHREIIAEQRRHIPALGDHNEPKV